tara:strand:+ start:746 stop:1513 length:768 start_codon:yes stop_codon:yes gene_type:complete
MPTNNGRSNYFQNYEASGEQRLIDNLVIESIQIYGQDSFYLPRNRVETDLLYGEAPLSSFDTSYPLELYVKSVEGYEGEGTFMSKFGLEIRDQINITYARRRFHEEVEEFDPSITRPREGDLIFLPWVRGSIETEIGAVFEVKYVQTDSVFYQLGNLQTFDVSLEKFEYSGELFQTGIPVIDAMTTTYSIDAKLDELTLATEAGVMIMTESGIVITNDNEDKRLVDKGDTTTFFQDEAAEFIDFSDINPFSENDF